MKLLLSSLFLCLFLQTQATDYHVGPGQTYTNINDVPWESMNAGDNVFIHYRAVPYYEKWVINVPGTSIQPFSVIGVLGPGGERPIISGNGATTRQQLSYWNEERSVIKVGGSSTPADGMPSHIVIENLEIRSGHTSYSFTDDNGSPGAYSLNAASIHVEKVNTLFIRNCVIHDSGNGIFIASNSNDVLIEKNHIYGNGNVSSSFEHNTYTEANGITYQYNRFGPLRLGAAGNNLKDRSAGLVVRYNYIEGGNRLLDMVETGNSSIQNDPAYRKTFIYGNILIEEDGGNSQVLHYGGDGGNSSSYRKGKLYFYNNSLYSIRAGTTTLARLSTNDETADIRNNILYVTASGENFAYLDASGLIEIRNNLIKSGWQNSHQGGGFNGTVTDDGSSIETSDPGFNNGPAYDFSLLSTSLAINSGTGLHPDASGNGVDMEYVNHQAGQLRPTNGNMDVGGYEYAGTVPVELSNPFRATLSGKSVRLTWSTASEFQVKHFLIERMDDPDTHSWITMPKGSPFSYEVIDENSPAGKVIYQLWELTMDGRKSSIGKDQIFINDQRLQLLSNLVQDQLHLIMPPGFKDKTWKIIHASGRLIDSGILNSQEIQVMNYPSGKYFLIVESHPPISFIKL
ncbi:MAG: polysaccharide-degrading enzyme [Saprospiraceae bacterium]|nr:polysaccharide-degrading enzyme [Saprospiraceae bacterium]